MNLFPIFLKLDGRRCLVIGGGQVGTQKIANVEELFAALRQHDPGKVVAISYVRDGETTTAQVQITDRPS